MEFPRAEDMRIRADEVNKRRDEKVLLDIMKSLEQSAKLGMFKCYYEKNISESIKQFLEEKGYVVTDEMATASPSQYYFCIDYSLKSPIED